MKKRAGMSFEAICEEAGLLLVGLDAEGRIVFCNRAMERLSGFTREEAIGRSFLELTVPGGAHGDDAACIESIRKGEHAGSLERYLVTRDGRRRLVSWRTATAAAGKGRRDVVLAVGMDITGPRLAEEVPAGGEGFFRMLIENALDLVTVLGPDGRIMYSGPSIARLLGYGQEEIAGRDLRDFLHPDDAAAAMAALDFAMSRPGVTGEMELRIRHKDGGYRVYESISCNLMDDPNVRGLVINSRDITERKKAEEELALRTREIEVLFEGLPDIYFRLAPDGTILDYRAGREAFPHVQPGQFMGRPVREVLPAQVGETAAKIVREVSEKKEPQTFEYRLDSPQGETMYEARLLPVLEDEVIAVVRDITERSQLISSLLDSEENYRVTFESTGSAMVILGEDGTILDGNQEVQKLSGYTREEVVGKKKYMEFILPEDRDILRRYSLRLLSGELKGPARYEARMVRRDGRVLNTIITVSVLPGIGKSVASIIDITEKKAYELELEERASQLRDFLDIAAHELRHPATLIRGYATTLDKYGREMSREDLENSLAAMIRGVEKLTGVVDDLLDLSRIERGFMSLERGAHAVLPLVGGAVDEMSERRSDRSIKVVSAEDPGEAWLDPEKFTRLMVILLDNAVKYSPPGSLVEVTVGRGGDDALVSVKDTGPGIPEAERNRVFDRFYKSEEVLHHSNPGLGLGLYIAKRIVEAHGGRIWHEAREGGGSVFRFTVPLHRNAAPG